MLLRRSLTCLVALPALLTASLVAQPAAGQAAAPADPAAALTAAVSGKILNQARWEGLGTAGQQDTRVTVSRRDGHRWAFGTAVVVAPHREDAHPTGSVFIARAEGDRWRVAFDGEADFAELVTASPIATEAERSGLAEAPVSINAVDQRTGMALPWTVGQSWYMTGGPHQWGGSGPYSSLDLAGGDQVVRATRAGTAYTMCKGWIRVIHDRGYSTDYYHLWNSISVNGASVGAGAFLGNTGTDVTCGGSATGRHVHFGLRKDGAYIAVQYHNLGKWVIYNGSSAYNGYALHGSTRVNAGGSAMYNYGALGFTQAIVDTNGGTSLNKRSGPGTGYAVAGSVADGATVSVSCSANGTTHTGRYGSTSLWNRLSDGTWVSDAYLWTGINGPLSGWC